jgi:hypothetical protein
MLSRNMLPRRCTVQSPLIENLCETNSKTRSGEVSSVTTTMRSGPAQSAPKGELVRAVGASPHAGRRRELQRKSNVVMEGRGALEQRHPSSIAIDRHTRRRVNHDLRRATDTPCLLDDP